ncbi:DNA cytosine methyltransferase [Pyxidicoccus xibeiensis]|uniref:DNA cytosine methyltransferase n=1 Tax=Pyxidicoccus xibeiensis TaxID=2906759 RepID=UPI0020A77806|nr:DNA cytosine methyltransferase [Pyxidicoccus xibeiensis]MCP3138685.1 DNA cytosine methyltransferase [Pyxidicoccus xibeiensis]
MKSVELFAGAGGLALGVHAADFKHEALVEFDKDACATLRTNAQNESVSGIGDWNVLEQDVRTMDFSPYKGADLLSGGVPCQPFSSGGKRRGRDDERNMFPAFIQAVCEIQPQAFIIENVKGLMWERFQKYFTYILLQLQFPLFSRRPQEKWMTHCSRLQAEAVANGHHDLEYTVAAKTLNAADFGVPQRRERVFIVGFQKKLGVQWSFPPPTHSREALLHAQWVTGAYWTSRKLKRPTGPAPTLAGQVKTLNRDIFHDLEPWATVRDALRRLPKPKANTDQGISGHRLVEGARSYTGHTGSDLDFPAKTLKAGVHGVPGGENTLVLPNGGVRYFTIREAARLQSFPDEWIFEGSWAAHIRQLGNAVPVSLVKKIASAVADHLHEVDKRGRGVRAA